MVSRPAHLQAFPQIERRISAPPQRQQPPTGWDVIDNDDDWGDDDDFGRGPTTRAQKARLREERNNPPPVRRVLLVPQQPPPPPPQQHQQPQHLPAIIEEEDDEQEEEAQDPLGFGLYDSDAGENNRQPQLHQQPAQQQQQPPEEEAPEGEHGANLDTYRDRHKCPACLTMFKLYNGTRVCPCNHDGRNKELRVDYDQAQLFVYDLDANANLGEVAYARGFTEHPDYFTVPQMAATVHAVRNTGTLMSPSDPSSSDDEHTTDYPAGDTPVHGCSPVTTDSEEQDPGPSERHRRNSSTRPDFLDETDPAPPQQPIQNRHYE